MARSTTALVTRRIPTIEVGVTAANKVFPPAAPNCTDRIPSRTSQAGETRSEESPPATRSTYRRVSAALGECPRRRYAMAGAVLLVGTRKGLWIGTSDEAREEWRFTGPHFDMEEVFSCLVDTRTDPPRLFAGASSSWLGPRVRRSDDLGATWTEGQDGGIRFPEGSDASVERVWQLVPGHDPDSLWAGTEPGAV